jgi:hypothetical protein
MTVEQQLLAHERQFWIAGADFYRKTVDDQCLLAFTDMAGVMSKESVAATIEDEPRWSDLAMEESGFLQLNDGVAILTYRARAQRADGSPYAALVSSAYVKRGGDWKLAFHQQTPLEG